MRNKLQNNNVLNYKLYTMGTCKNGEKCCDKECLCPETTCEKTECTPSKDCCPERLGETEEAE